MYFEKVKDLVVKELNCDPEKITLETNFVVKIPILLK